MFFVSIELAMCYSASMFLYISHMKENTFYNYLKIWTIIAFQLQSSNGQNLGLHSKLCETRIHFFYFGLFLEPTPCGTYGFLLTLCSGIPHGTFWGTYEV